MTRPLAELVTEPDRVILRHNPHGYAWYHQGVDFGSLDDAEDWLCEVSALVAEARAGDTITEAADPTPQPKETP